jgi:nitrite reductase (NADH) small subunit
MNTYVKAAVMQDFTSKHLKVVNLDGIEIVLFYVSEKVFAIENLCPHQLFSVFHQGILDGYTITCPMHSWKFDLRTGKAVVGSGRVKTFEVKIDGKDILIKKSDSNQSFSQF